MKTQDCDSRTDSGLMLKSKGTGKPPLPFTEELPTKWYFLFEEAKLLRLT